MINTPSGSILSIYLSTGNPKTPPLPPQPSMDQSNFFSLLCFMQKNGVKG